MVMIRRDGTIRVRLMAKHDMPKRVEVVRRNEDGTEETSWFEEEGVADALVGLLAKARASRRTWQDEPTEPLEGKDK